MSVDVVTVPPETPVVAIARLLAERGISAVPVLDHDGRLRGIVTEADLIRRLAGAEDRPAGWLRRLFADAATEAERYARTHGATASDVMTEQLVTVTPGTTATHVAHLLEEMGIRRVLVVEDGKLRGLVSRADLLRALVAPPEPAHGLSDGRIRAAVLAQMRKQPWADTFSTMVEVQGGTVTFHGFVRSEAARRALRVLAENIPGVTKVVDETQPMPAYLSVAA
ncbi:CBS domain-containing protein [Belnapia sp. T6]|uniref:CBS domain-containing protein n=2 Tax=Belnapia mucosa TaxID=2804532 RepID=A0ABS1V8Y0_9PROT|nr:CBS domain-containing protein [Belnapia mucosa]